MRASLSVQPYLAWGAASCARCMPWMGESYRSEALFLEAKVYLVRAFGGSPTRVMLCVQPLTRFFVPFCDSLIKSLQLF